jgi:hypothetical protein
MKKLEQSLKSRSSNFLYLFRLEEKQVHPLPKERPSQKLGHLAFQANFGNKYLHLHSTLAEK